MVTQSRNSETHVMLFSPPGPPCGPICINKRVENLLQEVRPQIQTLKEKLNTVSLTLNECQGSFKETVHVMTGDLLCQQRSH